MKKDLGVHPYLFPMPVLMIATYDENEKVDVMNMAWGGICAENMVALNIDEDHKTMRSGGIYFTDTLCWQFSSTISASCSSSSQSRTDVSRRNNSFSSCCNNSILLMPLW